MVLRGKINGRLLVSLAFGVLVFLFWLCLYPHALSYQEQNQLFLWTCDYLLRDLAQAGGLADYLGEFFTQFYYVTWLGALVLALLLSLFRYAFALVLRAAAIGVSGKGSIVAFSLSFVPALLMIAVMGDYCVRLTFLVALTLALLTVAFSSRSSYAFPCCLLADVLLVPLAFWLLGGIAAWVYIVLRLVVLLRRYGHAALPSLALPVYLVAVQTIVANSVLPSWLPNDVLLGRHYYSTPMKYPCTKWGFDEEEYDIIRLDWLVRNKRWDDILLMLDRKHVDNAFASNCANLALAQKGMLAEKMFSYYQSGPDALLLYSVRDNLSDYPTMEAFWLLGMVNSCLRYASDLQESILNARKSGRLTRRIAECHIVNGNYKAARKHLRLLRHSLFYSQWARQAEAMLGDETAINAHPVYGKMRRLRFRSDFLYKYEDKAQMLGKLFMDNTDNKMALDYFMGQLLLDGNHKAFMAYINWVAKYGGYEQMPAAYKDALTAIKANGNVLGSPYALYINSQIEKIEPRNEAR